MLSLSPHDDNVYGHQALDESDGSGLSHLLRHLGAGLAHLCWGY
ncbi:hypothetical protein NT01EI_1881 [Edwardsiella ictaluri 93-146]|uniref:Uncharacterized protein n=1 Tax=Edwardsiella ictaluri (strain 93-146) TaxID=634503 RepID=C5BGX8_EDWI9|nr:hypothetical protein NT01EI_1881 [Edwardsiella ictaluri 93-146]